MSFRSLILASAIALGAMLAVGCDNATSLGPLVPFSRPEHIAFACFAPVVRADGTFADDESSEFDVLPQECCDRDVDRNDTDACDVRLQRGTGEIVRAGRHGAPRLHALITQSTRGEVAAVDMTADKDERVLDSDSLIPGFTFLDSGGLPSAVVMPRKQPHVSGTAQGAKFVFVTSAEEYQLRAIPACRFRSGRACGPELDAMAANQMLAPRLILPLPSAPGDMILGPDEELWITLPELALIARVKLAKSGAPFDAFELDPATGSPMAPEFFRVPDAPLSAPPAPVAETEAYAEVCGVGVPYRAAAPVLPTAPSADPAPLRPKLLRFDARSGVLLVADASAPVIHAFALGKDGTLASRGALPTGAPIRDLALPDPVPATVARTETRAPASQSPAEAGALPSVRYLYAIDDRDGSVMVFDYQAEAGTARLKPLLAPVPNGRFADRLDIANLSAPAAALEVVDTRLLDTLKCDPAAPSTDTLRASAGPSNLRGVFLSVATESGTVALLDVYDVDLACRADEDCVYGPGADGVQPKRGDLRAAVAVRRHAARRSATGSLSSAPGNLGIFAELASCEAGYTQVAPTQGAARICAPTDPWFMLADSWSVQYQPSIPGANSPSGSLEKLDADKLVLRAPTGLDLCGRGVLVGDRVALSETTTGTRAQNDSCGTAGGTDEAKLLDVVEAYQDRLVLSPSGEDKVAKRDEFARCYPDFVRFDVRAGKFLVLGNAYLSNVIADERGACVADEVKRPQITSRAEPGKPFRNPYLQFQLISTAADNRLDVRGSSVPLTNGSTPLTSSLVSGNFSDVLPSELRFNPGTKELFVVDSASQGLTRYTLNPFTREN